MTSTLKISLFAICLMLLWALNPSTPYAYYQILRVVVFCFIIFLTFSSSIQFKHPDFIYPIIGIGILYNPIIKVSLDRSHWSMINIITVILLLYILTQQTKQQ